VTFVTSDDTQPGRDIERIIPDYFNPLQVAYSLIVLKAGGYPCVFLGGIYGIKGKDQSPPSCLGAIPSLVLARKLYSYREQKDFSHHTNCIGWVRRGTHDKKMNVQYLE